MIKSFVTNKTFIPTFYWDNSMLFFLLWWGGGSSRELDTSPGPSIHIGVEKWSMLHHLVGW